jgi:hypothetical protein
MTVRCKNLRTRYGITEEHFLKLRTRQKGACAICDKKTKLVVDHCHRTQKLRKLLCHNCNRGLGMFNDSLRLVKHAAAYLRRHSLRV